MRHTPVGSSNGIAAYPLLSIALPSTKDEPFSNSQTYFGQIPAEGCRAKSYEFFLECGTQLLTDDYGISSFGIAQREALRASIPEDKGLNILHNEHLSSYMNQNQVLSP
jgi:hypothetical protein